MATCLTPTRRNTSFVVDFVSVVCTPASMVDVTHLLISVSHTAESECVVLGGTMVL